MSSDKARVSHDANQQYRTVVTQQGRVTLEADWNEAQQIASEEEQANLINIIGSSGTPNDGYRVLETDSIPTLAFDFSVKQGTMYVGGNRVVLPTEVKYSNQSEWLDRVEDPDWVDPSILNTPPPQKEFIYLLLREQEVSAVEDSALRDSALGGPDTTQRTRLVQRIVRSQTEEDTCAIALGSARKHWLTNGLTLDSKTMRLKSSVTLRVSFLESAIPPDPCDPEARGGYLGAENQLIRVQISSIDLTTNQYKLVWGFDNASFLYRVTADNTGRILKFESPPVDDFHRPRTGQAVEVLRSAARLSNGEFIASATGQVVTLNAPYNPDKQEITLPTALPTDPYLNSNQTPRLFLRVWEEEIKFTLNTPVSLGKTGLQVTLATLNSQPFHLGDYWFFAVRPMTPTTIYPHRYFDSPQLPEGPSLWVCPLAVIAWNKQILKVLEDCRQHFDDLVELTKRQTGGCCTVIIRPEDLKGDTTLQSIVDRFTNRDRATICLTPGVYLLSKPLRLGIEHSNLTLEGCHDGVVFEVESGKESSFLDGMIILNHANNVTLRQLRFQLPSVPFIAAGGRIAGLKASLTSQLLGSRLQDLQISIGIRPLHCALLTIENCLFRYELTPQADLFGVGIFSGSECWGLTVKHCSFLHEEKYLQNLQEPLRVLIGYLLAPSLKLRSLQPERTSVTTTQTAGGSVTRSLLQDAIFANNRFAGLTFATLIMADTGNVTITNNTAVDCYSGFWLLTLRALSLQDGKLREIIASKPTDLTETLEQLVALSVLGMTQEPVTYLAILLSQSYPLPPQFNLRDAVLVPKGEIRNTALQPVTALIARASIVFSEVTASLPNLNLADVANSMQRLNITGFATKETIGFAKTLGDRLEILKLSALQRSVQFPLQLSLDFSYNSVQTLAHKALSGTPLFVWDTDEQTQSMMTMNANRLSNKSLQLATAVILQVDRCAVTGNFILNESIYEPKPNSESQEPLNIFYSLFFLPGSISPELLKNPRTIFLDVPIAVTGNVFKGFPSIFHVRPFPAPLNFWFPLNTQTW